MSALCCRAGDSPLVAASREPEFDWATIVQLCIRANVDVCAAIALAALVWLYGVQQQRRASGRATRGREGVHRVPRQAEDAHFRAVRPPVRVRGVQRQGDGLDEGVPALQGGDRDDNAGVPVRQGEAAESRTTRLAGAGVAG